MAHPELAEAANLAAAMTSMANTMAAVTNNTNQRFQQAAADSAVSWGIAMQSPTFSAASAQRLVTESGSGRTRAETNAPHETGAGGGGVG